MADNGSTEDQNAMFLKEMMGDFNWPDIVIAGRQKRPRENISVGQKRELCQYQLDNPNCKRRALMEFCRTKWGINIGKSTVSDILRHKDKWLKMPEEAGNIYRLFSGKYAKLEEQLIKWCTMMNHRFPNYKITDWMLKRQARVIGMRLNVDDKFGYSNGWIQRFKKRHGLSNKANKDDNTMTLSTETVDAVNSTMDTYSDNDMSTENEHPESMPVHMFKNDAETGCKASATITSSPGHDDSPEESNDMLMGVTIKSENIADDDEYGHCDNSSDKQIETPVEYTNEPTIPLPPPLTMSPHIVSIHQNNAPIIGESILAQNSKRLAERSPSPPEKRMRKSSKEHETASPYPAKESSLSSVVTRKEARKGIITCIRFIERTPELSVHLESLWEVYESLENSE